MPKGVFKRKVVKKLHNSLTVETIDHRTKGGKQFAKGSTVVRRGKLRIGPPNKKISRELNKAIREMKSGKAKNKYKTLKL